MQQNCSDGPFARITHQGMPARDSFGHPSPKQQYCHSYAQLEHFYQSPQPQPDQYALPHFRNLPRLTTNGQHANASWGNENAEEMFSVLDCQSRHDDGLPQVYQQNSAVRPDFDNLQFARGLCDGPPINERGLEAPAYSNGSAGDQSSWQHFDFGELQQMAPMNVACGPNCNCTPLLQAHPPGSVAGSRTFQNCQNAISSIPFSAGHAYEETPSIGQTDNYFYWHESRPPENLWGRLPPQAEMATICPDHVTSTKPFATRVGCNKRSPELSEASFLIGAQGGKKAKQKQPRKKTNKQPSVNAGVGGSIDNPLALQSMPLTGCTYEANREATVAPPMHQLPNFVKRASEHNQEFDGSLLPSHSGDRRAASEFSDVTTGSCSSKSASHDGTSGSKKDGDYVYTSVVRVPGTNFDVYSFLPRAAAGGGKRGEKAVTEEVQIDATKLIDPSGNFRKYWTVRQRRYERMAPARPNNDTSSDRKHVEENRAAAMDTHAPGLISMAFLTVSGAAQEVAGDPLAQSLIRQAIMIRFIDPIEGSNARRFKSSVLYKIYQSDEVQAYIDQIKRATAGHADACFLCLAAESNQLVKECYVAGRLGYVFKNDEVLNAVLALLFVHNAIADYKNLILLQLHASVWPAGVLGVLELIRHEQTLYDLRPSLSTSPIHFDLGCFCKEIIARAQPYIERGEGAPPLLLQLMHNHLPAKSQHHCMNLSAIATAYFRIIDKPGWLGILQPFCSMRYAACLNIDGRQFNLAYVGKQQTYEYEQKHYGLPSYIHIFMVAEQANGYQASAYLREPEIEFSEIRKFFSEATGDISFDPREIQFYCLATVSGFVAFGAAMFSAKIVSERSPWGLLELIVTASDMPTLSTSHVSVSGGMPNDELPMMCLKPAALNIRALYLRIDVSTAGVSSASGSLFSGSDITSTVFAMLGLDTPEALNALGNLAVSCFPLEKPHRLDGLFDDQTLWPKPEFFRAINCNLQTMNQDLLWHMLRGRSDDNLHYQGHLHILDVSNNNFANDTFVAVGPLLVEMCKQLRDLSLCFCSLQKDVLMGILDLAFCGEESKLEYLSLDGNQLLQDGQVFDVLYGHLTNMGPGAPTKLKRLSVTDIDFSAQQEDLLYAWVTRQNEAAKSKFYADISQTAAASVAAGVGKEPKFVEPVMITRLNQPSSSARAIPGTRCHNAVDMDWFNSIPKHKNFRDHFEIIWS